MFNFILSVHIPCIPTHDVLSRDHIIIGVLDNLPFTPKTHVFVCISIYVYMDMHICCVCMIVCTYVCI